MRPEQMRHGRRAQRLGPEQQESVLERAVSDNRGIGR
jgi:hypothetical protein